jgi:hypothetical protein
MYVRWKHRRLRRSPDTLHYAELVRSVWLHGASHQRVVGYLGAIREQYRLAPAHRAWFWARVDRRLAALGLHATTRQQIESCLAQVVPRPLAAELAVVARHRAALTQLLPGEEPGADDMARWPAGRH